MLFILAEKEEYFDNKDHGIKAFERAKGPKKLVTIPGITHYGIYGQARPQALKLAIEWYDTHLKGQQQTRVRIGRLGPGLAHVQSRHCSAPAITRARRRLSAQNAAAARGKMAIPGQGL